MGFFFISPNRLTKSIKLDPEKFGIQSYHYPYGPNYGYPKTDIQKIVPTRVEQSLDGSTIRVMIPNLEERKIYQFNLPQSYKIRDGRSLRNPVAYYTLNELLEN